MNNTQKGLMLGLIVLIILTIYITLTIHQSYDGSCEDASPGIFSFSEDSNLTTSASILAKKHNCSFTEYAGTQISSSNTYFGIPVFAVPLIILGLPAIIGYLLDVWKARRKNANR